MSPFQFLLKMRAPQFEGPLLLLLLLSCFSRV